MPRKLRVNYKDNVQGSYHFLQETLEKLYDVEISEDPEVIFYGDHSTRDYLKYDCKRIYVPVENNYPDYTECDYSLAYIKLRDKRNLRFPYGIREANPNDLIKTPEKIEQWMAEKTGFCSWVASNGNNNQTYRRILLFRLLNARKEVASGGAYMNNIGGERVPCKLSFIRPYRFNLAMENHNYPGYTTEKIVQAARLGIIPIYWGNPDIHKEYNPKSFINLYDYSSLEQATEHILEIENNPKLYRQYMEEPFFHHNSPNWLYKETRLAEFLKHAIDAPRRPRDRISLRPKFFDMGIKLRSHIDSYILQAKEKFGLTV